MADKQVKVAKPNSPKPQPVKPSPTKPATVKTPKAHALHGHKCARCKHSEPVVRNLCATCDLQLQDMHWNIEYTLFRRTFYLPEPEAAMPPLSWLKANGYEVSKPPKPKRFQPAQAMSA